MTTTPAVRDVAGDLQFPEGPVVRPDGTALVVEIRRGTLSRVGTNGTVEVVAELGGGPNGAAIGPDGACYVVNNGGFSWSRIGELTIPLDLETRSNEPPNFTGGWVERVDLDTGDHTDLYRDATASRSAARTTSSSTTPAASGSPTSARPAPATWIGAGSTTGGPMARR